MLRFFILLFYYCSTILLVLTTLYHKVVFLYLIIYFYSLTLEMQFLFIVLARSFFFLECHLLYFCTFV